MSTVRQIIHAESNNVLIPRARWCDSFAAKLRGFTFRRRVAPNEGLVLVEERDNRVSTAIHMLFVFCRLGVVWVNGKGAIVDTTLAKPWRLSYVPQAPARYVVEGHPHILQQLNVGDHLRFLEIA